MAAKNSASSSKLEYLKKYGSQEEVDKKSKKKRKTKSRPGVSSSSVSVVDADPAWHKPVTEENEDDSADEEKPQLEEDINVKLMKRLEQIKMRRPYNAISEDGRGWISISETPKQQQTNENDSDMSPPRKRYNSPSPEPHEREGFRSITLDTDISPPRRSQSQTMVDKKKTNFEIPNMHVQSPRRSSPDLDLSPPRQRRKRYHSPSLEPTSKIKNDLSPPRRDRKDISTRKLHQHSAEYDASRASMVSDLSPPRKSRKELDSLKERPKTGLITGQDIKKVNAKTKKDEMLRFQEMDPDISGRGAEPVYRDKLKGERITKDEFMKSHKKEEKPKEKKLEWGKGLAQKREAEAREVEIELEKDKPFARTRDDPELDKMLKERVRWGDPMAHLVKKNNSDALLLDLGDNEKMMESGFIIPQTVPNHSWMKRGLEAAPNRYGIKPGRHWDGVDRSNGFEKGFFKRTNEKEATQREAYLWSVSDM